jgi:hypothetical protein
MPIQSGANDPAQYTSAFTVDYADFRDAALQTFVQIRWHQVFHVPRVEGVEVQSAVNGDFNNGILEVIIRLLAIHYLSQPVLWI